MIPGESGRERHKIREGIRKEEVQIPPAALWGVECSTACAQRGVHPGQRAPRTLCLLCQMVKVEKQEHSQKNR